MISPPQEFGHEIKLLAAVQLRYDKDDPSGFIKNMYSHNSDGFRSDEFKTYHNGKHILFAGCSETYGVALFKENLWSYQVYRKISNSLQTSGYFNIGLPGATILEIATQIISYISLYGTPDILFVNLPDADREISKVIPSARRHSVIEYCEDYSDHIPKQAESLFNSISNMCGNKTYYFSWTDRPKADNICNLRNPKDGIKGFYRLAEEININRAVRAATEELPTEEAHMGLVAMDGMHCGIAFHNVWADYIYSKYLADNAIIDKKVNRIRR